MADMEKVIKGLRDIDGFIAGRIGFEQARNFLRTIDETIELLKEQQSNIKYWSAKYDEMGKQYMAVRDERDELLKEQEDGLKHYYDGSTEP